MQTLKTPKPQKRIILANTWFSFAQEKDKIIGLILLLLNKNEHGNYSQYR